MSRSGYTDDGENLNLYRGTVERSIKGKRGQVFLRDLAKALDDMPEKKLIKGNLVTGQGEVCAIGSVCKARGIDTTNVDVDDARTIGDLVDISWQMAAEIEFLNDDDFCFLGKETPEGRWIRMRKWVSDNLNEPTAPTSHTQGAEGKK